MTSLFSTYENGIASLRWAILMVLLPAMVFRRPPVAWADAPSAGTAAATTRAMNADAVRHMTISPEDRRNPRSSREGSMRPGRRPLDRSAIDTLPGRLLEAARAGLIQLFRSISFPA